MTRRRRDVDPRDTKNALAVIIAMAVALAMLIIAFALWGRPAVLP